MSRWNDRARIALTPLRTSLATALFPTLIAIQVHAAPNPDLQTVRTRLDRARAAEDAGRFDEALAAWDSLATANPYDGNLQEGIARARLARHDAPGAVAAWLKARELGSTPRPQADLEIARCWMVGGQPDSAMAWIETALADGYEQRAALYEDGDFSSIRESDRFKRLAGRPVGPAPDRNAAWPGDLDFVVAEIKRLHYVYSKAPLPAPLESDIAALRRDIPKLTDDAVFARFERIMAGLGDGHSVLYPVSDVSGPLQRLPLATYFFADGWYVVGAPPELAGRVGSRIESVGGVPTDVLLARLESYMPRDNDMGMLWTGPLMLSFPAMLGVLGAAPDPKAVAVTLVASDGKNETVTLTPGTAEGHMHVPKLAAPATLGVSPPRWLTRVNDFYWFEDMPDLKALYVQCNQVVDKDDESMRDFALRLRKHIDETHPKHLVIDLRHNNGGNSDRLIPFIRTAVHFETTTPGGRTWVLIGRNTFSAAQVLANNLDRLTNAMFLGEPSGSSPNFVGEDTGLRLPNSGYYGSISSRFHQTWNNDDRPWIAPDFAIPLTSGDYFAGRDPVMEALEDYLRTMP
ncbi:MAG TPA: hypothetical protein VF720_09105 [Candidatus Eisenbacteria bacterium]